MALKHVLRYYHCDDVHFYLACFQTTVIDPLTAGDTKACVSSHLSVDDPHGGYRKDFTIILVSMSQVL